MTLNRIAALVCLLAVGGVSCLYGQPPETIADTPYFPLKKGTRWVYQVKGQELKLTMTVAKYEKVDNKLCAVIETEQDGKVVASEYVHVDKAGVHRVKVMGQNAEPPILILKQPTKKGDSWKVESKVMGQVAKGTFTVDEEQLKVMKETHRALIARATDFEAAGQKLSTTSWFVEGIGMVKQEANIGGNRVELELVKFDSVQ